MALRGDCVRGRTWVGRVAEVVGWVGVSLFWVVFFAGKGWGFAIRRCRKLGVERGERGVLVRGVGSWWDAARSSNAWRVSWLLARSWKSFI